MNAKPLHNGMLVLFLLLALLGSSCSSLDQDQDGRRGRFDSKTLSVSLDSLLYATYFKDEYFVSSGGEAYTGFPKEFIPQYTDSVYAARIERLSGTSPFKLTYNEHVKGFIRVYSVDKRKATARIIGLTKVYFPMFEKAMRRHGVPPEMKYLAVIESALNPTAVSHAGALGLWQFMYGTGRLYGLESGTYTEDRFDPEMATDAAARHLRDLYDRYGDWFLALAAYNSGSGNVNRAIRKAGGKQDYWVIWKYLPRETRSYVPAFIAVNYIMHYYPEHNIMPEEPRQLYFDAQKITLDRPAAFDDVGEVLGVSVEQLRFLNPRYKLGIVPATPSNPMALRLPRRFVGPFALNRTKIHARYDPEDAPPFVARVSLAKAMPVSTSAKAPPPRSRLQTHMVRRGESVAAIARRYGTSIESIARLNGLDANMAISVGQRLRVERTLERKAGRGGATYHRVQKGDTLTALSKTYAVSIADIARWNRLGSRRTIFPGQKLQVSP